MVTPMALSWNLIVVWDCTGTLIVVVDCVVVLCIASVPFAPTLAAVVD